MSDGHGGGRPERPGGRHSRRPEERIRLNRRGFIALTAAGGVATAAVALGIAESESGGSPEADGKVDKPDKMSDKAGRTGGTGPPPRPRPRWSTE